MGRPTRYLPKLPKVYLVSELMPEHIYIDRLSFLRVLVLEDVHTGPSVDDVRVEVTTRVKYGLYYSAVYGKHLRMELHDGQLMAAP